MQRVVGLVTTRELCRRSPPQHGHVRFMRDNEHRGVVLCRVHGDTTRASVHTGRKERQRKVRRVLGRVLQACALEVCAWHLVRHCLGWMEEQNEGTQWMNGVW